MPRNRRSQSSPVRARIGRRWKARHHRGSESCVAMVEAMQPVRIVAVAEVGAQRDRPRGGGVTETLRDSLAGYTPASMPSQCPLPPREARDGAVETRSAGRHSATSRGAKGGLRFKPPEQRRAGKGGHNRKSREIDFRFEGEASRRVEDFMGILIEAENEAPCRAIMRSCNRSTTRVKCSGRLNPLPVALRFRVLIDSSPIKRPRHPLCAARSSRGRSSQSNVVASPNHCSFQRNQRGEQAHGVRFVRDQIEVHENGALRSQPRGGPRPPARQASAMVSAPG